MKLITLYPNNWKNSYVYNFVNECVQQIGQSLVEELQFGMTQSWWIHLLQVHCSHVLPVSSSSSYNPKQIQHIFSSMMLSTVACFNLLRNRPVSSKVLSAGRLFSFSAAFWALSSSLCTLFCSIRAFASSFSFRFVSFCSVLRTFSSSLCFFSSSLYFLFSSLSTFLLPFSSASWCFFSSFSLKIAHASELVRTRARPVLGFLFGSGVFGSWRKSTKGERTGVTETDIFSGKLDKRVRKNLTCWDTTHGRSRWGRLRSDQ